MNQNKQRLWDYFDKLVNLVNRVDGFDNYRDELIKEIRDVETYNLISLSGVNTKPKEALSNARLFQKFCFLVETSSEDRLAPKSRLIVTDAYLSEAQIKCFQTFMNSVLTPQSFFYPFNFEIFFTKIKSHVKISYQVLSSFKYFSCISNFVKGRVKYGE
jgi:hypothetical protein